MKVERKQRAVPSLVLFELTFGRDLKTFEPKEKKENHKEKSKQCLDLAIPEKRTKNRPQEQPFP